MFQVYKTFTRPDGLKEQRKFRGKTLEEAERKRDRAIWEYEQGLLCYNDKTTIAAYASQWIEKQERMKKPLTKDAISRLQKHVIANIGGLTVRGVKPLHIETCLAEVAGTSQSNINKTWGVMYRLFKAMVNDELLLRNPMDKVEKPKGTVGKRRPLTQIEQEVFRAVLHESMMAEDIRRRYDLIFGIVFGCGLRPGEVRALSWSNVILDKKYPYVRVTNAVKREDGTIGGPKTSAGRRDVMIPLWLAAYLRQYYTEWVEERKKTAVGSLLLFPSLNGSPVSKTFLERRWRRFLNRMDLLSGAETYRNQIIIHSPNIGRDLTAYYLRHTYRTNLAEWEVNPLVAAYWMGHDDSRINDIGYASVTQKMIRAAIDIVNREEEKRVNTAFIQTDTFLEGER